MAQCLVTGGAGFIGSHIVRRLLKDGHAVRVLDDFSTGRRENMTEVADDVELIEGDIRDLDTMQRAAKSVEWVFHLAAQGSVPKSVEVPDRANEINVTGTLNALLAARDNDAQRFMFSASSSAYGDTPTLPKTVDMCPHPLSPYAVSKLAGEHYCLAWYKCYGLPTVSLRYFNVFGPRQDPNSTYAAVIPAWVSRMLRGESPVVYGDGEQTRDFCYIDNVVHANLLAANADELHGEVVNIACGERTSLNQILKDLNELLGTDIAAEYTAERAGDVRHSLADISVTKEVLGYEPLVMFSEGLRQSIVWYKENL